MMKYMLFLSFILFAESCGAQTEKVSDSTSQQQDANLAVADTTPFPSMSYKYVETNNPNVKTIHVFVALCDNTYQGIVPVPEKIGNGQDPNTNLYWGCGYGVRTFFKKSKEWEFVQYLKPDSIRLERLVFRHKTQKCYLVADAYDGRCIKNCTWDFMASASGEMKDTIHIDNETIGIDGNASLVAYIGHDGLMEFQLPTQFKNKDGKKRDCIILACSSRDFFGSYVKQTGANPIVWTASLMCPEAYTLHDAISSYLKGENAENNLTAAAKAYSKYQKIPEINSRTILVTGW
jgi:hypothetical protein